MVNVAANVWSNADRDPGRTALRSSRGDLSYGELKTASSHVAGAIRDAGLRPLDRVVFIAPSITEFAVVYYGLHAAGISVITMNTMATAPEIGYVLDDSEATLVIAWHECATAAASAAADRGIAFWQVEDGAAYATVPLDAPH